MLPVRERLTCGAIAKIAKIVKAGGAAATSVDCAWRRRMEMLFERLVEIGGPPLTDQTRLLGGYRMADTGTQRWVRRTIGVHPEKHIAELAGPG